MHNFFLCLKESSFFRASSVLFSASILANLIGLAGFILLSRFYDIETLGIIFTLTASITIVNIVAVMGYQQAIPLMRDKEVNVLFTGMMYALSIFYIATLPILFISSYWLFFSSYVYLGVLSIVSDMILIRDHQNIQLVRVRVIFPILLYSLSLLGFYFYGDNILSLMAFQIIALALRPIIFYRSIFKKYFRKFKLLKTIAVLRRYKRFPRYIGPGIIFYTVAFQLPIVVAGVFFSPMIASQYNMAFRLAFSPVQMLGGAISEAYTQFLSAKFRSRGNLFEGFGRLRFALLCIGIVSTISVYFLMPVIISSVLNEKWQGSIDYVYALVPILFAVVSLAPISPIFQFTNNQRYIFYMHLSSFFITLFSFSLAIYYSNFLYGVISYSFANLLRYVYVLIRINRLREEYEYKS